MDFKKMNIEDIIDWCKENGEVAWLKKESQKTFKTKDGSTRKISFIEIKRNFAKKFMPAIIPTAKPKKPTMYDLINSL